MSSKLNRNALWLAESSTPWDGKNRAKLIEELRGQVQDKKVLILGIGNRLCGDDAFGSILAERLAKKVNIPVIDAGDVPENYLGPVEASGADLVLVLDAADLGTSPGDLSLLRMDRLQQVGLSTHASNLGLVFQAIPEATRPDALLVAVQPGQTETGRGLSRSVERTMEGLEDLLVQLFG